MDELSNFCKEINEVVNGKGQLSIDDARTVVRKLNDFLYTNYEGIGKANALDRSHDYLSDFHKYWEKHYKEILDCKIDDDKCQLVADALHKVYQLTAGKAFSMVATTYDESGLSKEAICKVRLLTANQDFRGSRNFRDLATIYDDDPSSFDVNYISEDPEEFIKRLGFTNLSQSDKRTKYAKTIADFVINHSVNNNPYEVIKSFGGDIYKLRNALIDCQGAGYGAKKADMMLRDMVVLGIWKDVKGFDKIDVASDINTIKVALRTGILKTAIPLVSSFIDIFCYQYSYIDQMNAAAWRRVWELWMAKYPDDDMPSPCLIDFFVYNVVGRQFCNPNLYLYQCETGEHTFSWYSGRCSNCQVCVKKGIRGRKANYIGRVMPCCHPEGYIAIRHSAFVKSLPVSKKMDKCPFSDICERKNMMPPKSISIIGRTGWTTAYTQRCDGGGGLMA